MPLSIGAIPVPFPPVPRRPVHSGIGELCLAVVSNWYTENRIILDDPRPGPAVSGNVNQKRRAFPVRLADAWCSPRARDVQPLAAFPEGLAADAEALGELGLRQLVLVRLHEAAEVRHERRRRLGLRRGLEAEQGGVDVAGLVQDEGALDGVLQLAHVAGPVVGSDGGNGVVVEVEGRASVARAELGDEVAGQEQSVALPVAERGQPDLQHPQPVVEVLAERALLHEGREVAVGGGDDARVDGHRHAGTHGPDRLVLQRAQQTGLRGGLHLPDLVEEDGAALRGPEQAGLVSVGAGERTAHVAEQLRLDEVGRDRGAVDRDEGTAGTLAASVDGPRHELLARA